ncbi:hypothetical protein MUO98_03780, partial [Candidatus Bathyarchaeota archaeon]|nr:hypothetical protein [Candidatus Bathyarchaeota archaeon]
MNLLLTFESRRRTGESDFVYTKHERKIMKKEGFAEALAQLLISKVTFNLFKGERMCAPVLAFSAPSFLNLL